MDRELEGRDSRRIRVHTRQGTVEGLLTTSPGVSTLHYLNVVSASLNFLRVHPPLVCSAGFSFDDAPLAVANDAILFVVELSEFKPRPGDPDEAARFRRAPVRLRMDDHVVDGFVHVPPGGDPIARMNQDRHAFIALTSVNVTGPDGDFSAPFLAAKHGYITAVQEVVDRDALAPSAADRAVVDD